MQTDKPTDNNWEPNDTTQNGSKSPMESQQRHSVYLQATNQQRQHGTNLQFFTRTSLSTAAVSNSRIYDQFYNLHVHPGTSSEGTSIVTYDSQSARPSTLTLIRDVPSSLDEPLTVVGVDCPPTRASIIYSDKTRFLSHPTSNCNVLGARSTKPSVPDYNTNGKHQNHPCTPPAAAETSDSPSARPSTLTLTRDVPSLLDEPPAAVSVDRPPPRASISDLNICRRPPQSTSKIAFQNQTSPDSGAFIQRHQHPKPIRNIFPTTHRKTIDVLHSSGI